MNYMILIQLQREVMIPILSGCVKSRGYLEYSVAGMPNA